MRDGLLRRRRALITSPLEWQMTAAPVAHPVIPVLAERGGTQLQTPRPTLLVDTREQNPFNFSRFQGWFAGIEKKALQLGDYSIAGLEDICVVERKDQCVRARLTGLPSSSVSSGWRSIRIGCWL